MRGNISMGRGSRRLLIIAAALFGTLLATCASASAKTAPELTLNIKTGGAPGTALSPSFAYARATQAPAAAGEAREAISITSATPSVCTIVGYVWGPGEELPPEREMEAQAWVYGDGTCTLVASVQATSTTEAAEVSKSFTAGGPPTPQAPKQPALPEITFAPPGQTYLGSSPLSVEAKSTRPGLSVSSSTPAVCTVSPSQPNHLGVVVDLITTGTCTLAASLPQSAEHEAVVVTKSILIAMVSFTSTPPSSAVAGGSYEVTASSAPGLSVQLGVGGWCLHLYQATRGTVAAGSIAFRTTAASGPTPPRPSTSSGQGRAWSPRKAAAGQNAYRSPSRWPRGQRSRSRSPRLPRAVPSSAERTLPRCAPPWAGRSCSRPPRRLSARSSSDPAYPSPRR